MSIKNAQVSVVTLMYHWLEVRVIYPFATDRQTVIIDGWLRMGLLPPPPLGNFADISYLVEN